MNLNHIKTIRSQMEKDKETAMQLEIKHTSGPWKIQRTHKHHFLMVDKHEKIFAVISTPKENEFFISDQENEMNIKLIATAPELLEVTNMLLTEFIFSLASQCKLLGFNEEKIIKMTDEHKLVISARGAIKKATE